MQKHTHNYFEHFNIDFCPVSGWHDYISCEYCSAAADDIHHIEKRIKGVDRLDKVENLIALCRGCHIKVHSGIISKDELIYVHNKNMMG